MALTAETDTPLPTVVIAQNDTRIAQKLAASLGAHLSGVSIASGTEELRRLLEDREVRLAVLDMEMIDLDEVRRLAHASPTLAIVCTQRSPDDRMWIAALNAGAIEYCHPLDIRAILRTSNIAARYQMPRAA